MAKPTKQDAELLLRLIELFGRGEGREASRWVMTGFAAKDYAEFKKKYPEGSPEFLKVGEVLGFFETAGVLISNGLLNEDVFFDLSFGLTPIWKKLGPIVAGWQKASTPALWENAAWLAKRYERWQKKVWKPNLKWKKV
jgi:hypothetical protein